MLGGMDPTAPLEIAGGHRAPVGSPPFPGGIGVSQLRVYDTTGPDGLAGGTPHCHTACTEAYAVVAGHGRVQTLGGDGFRETPLAPGSFAWFTPGTIHRLVNDSGDLEILVLMANAGLPEAGDLVITFPDDVLARPEAYAAAARLPDGATTTDGDDEPARRRRDRAIHGFLELAAGGPEALAQFHQRAVDLVAPSVPAWQERWEAGPLAAAQATGDHLRAIASGDPSHLGRSSVHELPPPPAARRYGCCGLLGVVQPAEPPGA
jgi:mannose-6-phosphate isomerase-like protein (cupin superfamily)